jgi:hypothetical protein
VFSDLSFPGSEIPIDLHGILTCITDGLIVYIDYDVLYSNSEGLLILEQTNYKILDKLQFKRN